MKRAAKFVLWSLAAIAGLLALFAGTAVVLVKNSAAFRHYLLAKAAASVYESSGARFHAGDFSFRISDLTVDLPDVVVRGTEPQGVRPLFQAERVTAGITVDSVLRGKWHFREVSVSHPVAHLIVNKAGENNLPKPGAPGGSKTNLFDLGIRRLILDKGQLYFNDRESNLDADVHSLQLLAGFDPAQNRYEGHLSYDQGHVRYGVYTPPVHALDAGFSATPARFTVDPLRLSTEKSQAIIKAVVDGYSQAESSPRVQARYDASLAMSELAEVVKTRQMPQGTVRLTGLIKYQSAPGEPVLNTISVWGMLNSPEFAVQTPGLQTTVRNLAAKYRLENGDAEVQNLRAELMGGTLEGSATVRDLAGAGQGRLEASLKNVSLEVLGTATRTHTLRQAHLVGSVNADASASWSKALKNLVAHGNATIKAALGRNPATPLNGEIHAAYFAANHEVALHKSYLRTPHNSLMLDGSISRLSKLQFRLQARDLHELELLAEGLRPLAPGLPARKLDLYGTASLSGSVSGALDEPQIQAQLAADNFRVKDSSWKLLRAGISASPSQLSLSRGELASAALGRIRFSLQTALQRWSYTASSPLTAKISATQVSLKDLQRLANKSYPLAGTLALDLSIHGTQLNPVGHGSATLTNLKIAKETIQRVHAQFQGDGKAVNVGLNASMPAGKADAAVTYYPQTESYQARLQANDIRLEKLAAVAARGVPVIGGMNVNAEGRGTLKNPELTATVIVPVLQVQKQTIKGVKLQAQVQNRSANVAFASEVAGIPATGGGTISIDAPYAADLHLDTGKIDFQPVLALYAPAQTGDIAGQTELHVSLRGPLAERKRLEVHAEAPLLNVSYQQFQIAAVSPLKLDYQNGVAVLQPASFKGSGADIRIQASVPVNNPREAAFLVQGTLDLRAAEMLRPGLTSSGRLEFDLDSRRYAAGGAGEIRIVDASVQLAALPVGLDRGNGVIKVGKDHLEIASFNGEMGGGTMTAKGNLIYRPAARFSLGLAAKGIRLRYPQGLRTVFDSNLTFAGTRQASSLSGQVLIDHASFTPDFKLSSFIEQFGTQAPAPATGFAQSVKLNVSVQSTSEMNLSSSQLSVRGNANLRIAGTVASPVVLGRANLSGGELFVAGNRYTVETGTVDFVNPVRTQPLINLRARTTVDQYNIALNMQGPLDRLQINYTSDPALPPADIINLLAFGKTTEAAAVSPSPISKLGAQSVLAQGIGSVVSSSVAKFAGLPHFTVDPALGGYGQNPGARFTIQQRVTSNLYVTYATDVTSTQRPAIALEYRFNPKWSVNGVRDQNGGFAVTGHYHKDF